MSVSFATENEAILPKDGKEGNREDELVYDWYRIYFAAITPALGFFVYGSNFGATTGFLLALEDNCGTDGWDYACVVSDTFMLTELAEGTSLLAASITLFGFCLFGVSPFGRVWDLVCSATAFVVAPLVYSYSCMYESWNDASGFIVFIVGQCIFGVGVAMAAKTVGPYLSEISPYRNRGAIGVVQELGAVSGICFSLCFTALLEDYDWVRTHFFIYWVPGWVAALGMFAFLPWTLETPRSCILKGQSEEAIRSFQYLCPSSSFAVIQKTVAGITDVTPSAQGTAMELISAYSSRLKFAFGLVFFQAASGESNMIYYSSVIISAFTDGSDVVEEIALGVCKLFACLVCGSIIDTFGRRTMMTAGTVGLTISTALAASILYYAAFNGIGDTNDGEEGVVSGLVMVALCSYVFCYDLSFGPQTWLLLPELFPTEHRDFGNALALAFSSGFSFLVGLLISYLFDRHSASYATDGSIFAVLSVGGLGGAIFTRAYLPETAQLTLEAASRGVE